MLAVTVVCVLSVVLTIVAFVLRGPAGLPFAYTINIAVDIFGMVIGYVIAATCIIDVAKTGINYRIFFFLLNVVHMGLLTDAGAWLVDGVPSLRIVNILDNTLYYACTPVAAYCFYMFITTQLKLGEKSLKTMRKYLMAGLVITLLIIFFNLPFGYLFTVGEDGIYHRQFFSPYYNIYGYATMLAALVLIRKERKQLEKYKIVTLVIYAIVPIIVSIFTAAVYGLSLGYATTMCIMILMYGIINVSQGREQVATMRDLEVASAIQESMMPRIFPPYPDRSEIDIYAYMDPAKEVGGDFYDFFFTDPDHLVLVIADVSGKGVPAALFMMITKVLIKNSMQGGYSPGEALYKINNQMVEGGEELGMFVTVWIAKIEISTGRGVSVNAGHEHPVICRAGGEFEVLEYPHSPAVSVIKDMDFEERDFVLDTGDVLFVYTDGVPEAVDHTGEQYETDRLLGALNSDKDRGARGCVDRVISSMNEFTGATEQFDDITMLCFGYNGGKS